MTSRGNLRARPLPPSVVKFPHLDAFAKTSKAAEARETKNRRVPVHTPTYQTTNGEETEVYEVNVLPGTRDVVTRDTKGLFKVERHNQNTGRSVCVTMQALQIVGANKDQTRITLLDISASKERVILSMSHNHNASSRTETVVHKNLLLVSQLADVPVPVEIPADSDKMFLAEGTLQHLHTYLERVIPLVRAEFLPGTMKPVAVVSEACNTCTLDAITVLINTEGVTMFWWRAVGSGAIVLLNVMTGRLIILQNSGKSLASAVVTLGRAIDLIRQGLSGRMFNIDEDYPTSSNGDLGVVLGSVDDVVLGPEEFASLTSRWALEDSISPWLTKYIVQLKSGRRLRQPINYRYSVGVGADVESHVMLVQVHSNEPLSRELKAFPVCVLPMKAESQRLCDVRLTYNRAAWFLRKLFEFHHEKEATRR